MVTHLITVALFLKLVLNLICKRGGVINSKIHWKILAHDINYKNVNFIFSKIKIYTYNVIQAKNPQYNPSALKSLTIRTENLPN